jgi:hypothetical protein
MAGPTQYYDLFIGPECWGHFLDQLFIDFDRGEAYSASVASTGRLTCFFTVAPLLKGTTLMRISRM